MEKEGIPAERTVLLSLSDLIKQEGLRIVAQEIFDGLVRDELPNPEAVRDRLDRLCFSLEHERRNTLTLTDAPLDYHEEIQKGRIPCGIQTLDEAMGGGTGRGEISCVVTPPNGGKTAWLVWQGARALLHGLHVLHVSLEIHGPMVLERYDQHLCQSHWQDFVDQPRVIEAGRRLVRKAGGELTVVDLTSLPVGAGHIRSLLRKASRNRRVDLCIVDYPSLLRREKRQDARFGEIGQIVRRLRMIASEMQVPMWIAAQANREAIWLRSWGKGQIAEDVTIVATVDSMICINQTLKEYEQRKARVLIEKTRRTSTKPMLTIHTDFDRMTFRESVPHLPGGKDAPAVQVQAEGTRRKSPQGNARQKRAQSK